MTYLKYPLAGMLALGLVLAPSYAHAATKKASCELTVTTAQDETTIKKDGEVVIKKGDDVTIAWESKNASKATLNKDAVDTEGEEEYEPTKKTTYRYEFTGSGKKAVCEVDVLVAEGSISESSLSTTSSKPKLSGTASGVKKVVVVVTEEGKSKATFTKSVKVKSGKWHTTISKKLSDGEYDVELRSGKGSDALELDSATLVVGEDSDAPSTTKTEGTISVTSVPLLFGGTATAGKSVPVSYLQLVNQSKSTATFTGVWIKQNGSAPTSVITGLEVRDDQGVTRGKTGVGASIFNNNGMAFAPANVVLAPGERRLFTVRAQMAANLLGQFGKNLMIDVTSIESSASGKGMFPIKGTTWTIQ